MKHRHFMIFDRTFFLRETDEFQVAHNIAKMKLINFLARLFVHPGDPFEKIMDA